MYSSLFSKTLWERRKSIFFWSIGIFAFSLLIGLLYPSMDGIEGFDAVMEEMPDAFQALIGEIDDITSPTGFLGAELFNLMLPLTLSILAIGFGASAIAKEEENGTVELLLSTSISRGRLVVEKSLALAVNIAIVAFSSWLGIALSTLLVDFSINLQHTLWATIAVALLALTFGALTLMVTALGGGRGLAVGIMTVLFIISYFSNTLALLIDELEVVRNFSLLYYYDGQSILEGGSVFGSYFVLSIVSAIAFALAFIGFTKRDIK